MTPTLCTDPSCIYCYPSGMAPGGVAQAIYNQMMSPRTIAATGSVPVPAPVVGEFGGKEFAAGVATGTRSFDVDKLGRLLGVSYRTVWTPGENLAACMTQSSFDTFSMMIGGLPKAIPADRPEHSLTECGHGFYGYYDGSNDYYAAGRIMGVIEGYGEAVIGSRGFRCMKARIVALHIPSDVNPSIRRLVARNYPDVPLFDSFDAMVAEFPADDAGEGISPASDPEFWTREVAS